VTDEHESPGALNDRVYADYWLSRLEFREYPEIRGLSIEMIAVEDDGRGHGRFRGAMVEILQWADATGTTLYLTAHAMDETVCHRRLESFYLSLGFVKRRDFGDFTVNDLMMREPGAVGITPRLPRYQGQERETHERSSRE